MPDSFTLPNNPNPSASATASVAPATLPTELKLTDVVYQHQDAIIFDGSKISSVAQAPEAFIIFYLTKEDEDSGFGTVIQLDGSTKQAAIFSDLNPEYTYLFFTDEQHQLQTLLWCIEFATRTNDGLYVTQAKVHGRGLSEEDMRRLDSIKMPGNAPQPSHPLAESDQLLGGAAPAVTAPITPDAPAPMPVQNATPAPQPAPPMAPTNVAPPPFLAQAQSSPAPAPVSELNLPPLPGHKPIQAAATAAAPTSELSLPPLNQAEANSIAPVPSQTTPPAVNQPANAAPANELQLPPLPPLPDLPTPPVVNQQPIAPAAPVQAVQPISMDPVTTLDLPPLPPLPDIPSPRPANPAPQRNHTAPIQLSPEPVIEETDPEEDEPKSVAVEDLPVSPDQLEPAPLDSAPMPDLPPLPPLPDVRAQANQPFKNPNINQQPVQPPTMSPAGLSQATPAPPKQPVGRPPKPLTTEQLWMIEPSDFTWLKTASREPLASYQEELRQKVIKQIRKNRPGLVDDWQFHGRFEQAFQAIAQTYDLVPTLRHDLLKALLNGKVVDQVAKQGQVG